jgi:hypothetical protein
VCSSAPLSASSTASASLAGSGSTRTRWPTRSRAWPRRAARHEVAERRRGRWRARCPPVGGGGGWSYAGTPCERPPPLARANPHQACDSRLRCPGLSDRGHDGASGDRIDRDTVHAGATVERRRRGARLSRHASRYAAPALTELADSCRSARRRPFKTSDLYAGGRDALLDGVTPDPRRAAAVARTGATALAAQEEERRPLEFRRYTSGGRFAVELSTTTVAIGSIGCQ